jgi:hypothetical protein
LRTTDSHPCCRAPCSCSNAAVLAWCLPGLDVVLTLNAAEPNKHRIHSTCIILLFGVCSRLTFVVCCAVDSVYSICRVQYKLQAKKRPEVQLPTRPTAVAPPESPRANRPLTAAERDREREKAAARERERGGGRSRSPKREGDRAAADRERGRGRGRSRSPPRRPSGGVDRDRGYGGPPGPPFRSGSGRLPSPPRRGSGSG